MSTDTTAATEAELPVPVPYGTGDDAVTFTIDSADYRLAKFRNELADYVELQSCLFYYLFTELFLMVDSRAKNMFPSCMGAPVSPVEPEPSEEPDEPASPDEPEPEEPGSSDEPGSDDPGSDDPGSDDLNQPTGE